METKQGIVINSVEVADMVGKPHNDLMKDIWRYITQFGEGNLSHFEYFTESVYTSEQNMLAGVFEKQSKYVEAIELYTKSLNTYKLMCGDNHIKIAECYNNLAYVYKTLKKYAEAEKMFIKSIAIIKQVHGESCFNIAIVYDNLAQVYGNQGKYEEAEYYYNKSIKINQKAYGENNPEVAKNYHNLARLFRNQKQYLKALD